MCWGKTTVINLACMLKHLCYRVLLVDSEQQWSLSKCLLSRPGGVLAQLVLDAYGIPLPHPNARRSAYRE